MALDPDMPYSRKEMYLAKAAGEDVTLPECPWSREEYYLAKIAEGGGGGGYVLPIATASELGGVKVGSNLAIDSGTGVLSGNYSAFTGTNGVNAGTTGLVPAPTVADAGKFLKADGTWDTAGGGGPTVVQTTGTSTTDVMSQNATTSMVYADPSSRQKVQIGQGASTTGSSWSVSIGRFAKASDSNAIAIGGGSSNGAGPNASATESVAIVQNSKASAQKAIAIGAGADAGFLGSIALGAWSKTGAVGEINVGTISSAVASSYNSSGYRLLSGLYDPQTDHDAATKGYVDAHAPVVLYTTEDISGALMASNVPIYKDAAHTQKINGEDYYDILKSGVQVSLCYNPANDDIFARVIVGYHLPKDKTTASFDAYPPEGWLAFGGSDRLAFNSATPTDTDVFSIEIN